MMAGSKPFWRALPVVGLAFLLVACDAPRQTGDALKLQGDEALGALAKSAGQQHGQAHAGGSTIHEGIWMGGRSLLKPNGDPLPMASEGAGAIVLNSFGAALDLREISAEIAAQSGIRVMVEEDPDPRSAAARPAGVPVPARVGGMALNWSGSLSGLLDAVASYFGMQWDYRGGQIRLYRNEARTFTLAALPSMSTIRSGVTTTGGGTSGNGGGQAAQSAGGGTAGTGGQASGSMMQDTSNETSIKLWEDIKAAIDTMLPAGGKATMSPATGTLTVLAPPLAMRRIAAYVEEQNGRIIRQVTVSVKVLRVDLNDSYDLGLDLGGVFRQLSGQYAVSLAGPAPLPVTAGTPASYLIQTARNGSKGQWATGSELAQTSHAVVDALQTMGKVSLMTETSVTTLNGQVAPVSVAEQQSYVASTATTLASGTAGTTQTQVTPATLVTGFNMQLLPRILDDGQVLLQYSLSLSDLKALNEFESNGTRVQLPDVNIRSFLQQSLMHSGDLLVLAGYQSVANKLGDTGLPGIGPSLLGGSVQSARSRSILVIMMAPQLLARSSEDRF